MAPLPIQELDGSGFFETNSNSRASQCAENLGRRDFAVLDSSSPADLEVESGDLDAIANSIRRGAAEFDREEYLGARESLAMIRARYGL